MLIPIPCTGETDVTAGERHAVDILVETRLKEEPGLILVHVEPQAYVQKDFNGRMFIYFSRLYEKYRRKILPVAVFSYDQVRDEPDSFALGFTFLDVLRFRYARLELKKLSWRDYLVSDNPVAAALLSKMGFSPEEKVQVKLEFMRMLARLKLDPARTELIGGFFETYLKLNRQEEEEFYRELGKMDQREVEVIMQITTSWHEKGREEGIAQGIAQGITAGQVNLLLKQIKKRFGELPAEVEAKIRVLNSEEIEKIGEALFDLASIDDLKKLLPARN